MSSYEVDQIIKKHPISDYLLSKGFVPSKVIGNKSIYKCLLPGHPGDNTPSFYVYDKEGKQDFCCFGCKAAGSIINLVHYMEDLSINEVVERLSDGLNLNIDNILAYLLDEIAGSIDADSKEEEIWPHSIMLAAITNDFLLKVNLDPIEFALCEKMYLYVDDYLSVNDLDSIKKVENLLPKKLRSRLLTYTENIKKEDREDIKSKIIKKIHIKAGDIDL